MKKDTEFTDVIFRVDTTKDFKGTVFALFPHEVCDKSGSVTTYQHVGQHSAANYVWCIKRSRPATTQETLPLFNELTNLGYLLQIVKRQNYNKYLISFRNR
jgi:hypothetical protein